MSATGDEVAETSPGGQVIRVSRKICASACVASAEGCPETAPDRPCDRTLTPAPRAQFHNLICSRYGWDTYGAFDRDNGIEVAWNVIKRSLLPDRASQQALSESIVVCMDAACDHPSILTMFYKWQTETDVVVCTELFSAGSLARCAAVLHALSPRHRLPPSTALPPRRSWMRKTGHCNSRIQRRWARAIAGAVAHLHGGCDKRIVLRTLSSEGVFVNGHTGELRLGLFTHAALEGSAEAPLVGLPGASDTIAPPL